MEDRPFRHSDEQHRAADPVLRTGGEMSRVRIGADKIGRPETKNIAGEIRGAVMPDQVSAIPRRPDSCTEQRRQAVARTGRVLSVPDRGTFPRGLRAVGIYAARIMRPTEI